MPHQTNSLGDTFKEVLGSLSIIIFLSSPSMAAYTTASAKNRANQILNGASVRAMVVSSKIQQSEYINFTSLLNDFSDTIIGEIKFSSAVSKLGPIFSLFLTGIDSEICHQMKTMTPEDGFVRISENCETLTYNLDLTEKVGYPSSVLLGDECLEKCQGEAACVEGLCQCPEGKIWNPKGDNKLGEGRCFAGVKGCTKNQDCLSEEYCSIHRNSDTAPNYGNCKDKGNLIFVEYNNHRFYFGKQDVSWWGARNFCLAHGKKLSRLESLGLTKDYRYTEQEGPLYQSFNSVGGVGKKFWTGNTNSEASAYVLKIDTKEESCYDRARRLALSTYPLCE